MPSPHRPDDTNKLTNEAHEARDIEGLPDIAIGVASVSWDKEQSNFR